MALLLCGTHWFYKVVLFLRMEFLFMPSLASWHCIERVQVIIILLDLWYMGFLLCDTHWIYEWNFCLCLAGLHDAVLKEYSLQIWVSNLTQLVKLGSLFAYKGVFFFLWGTHVCWQRCLLGIKFPFKSSQASKHCFGSVQLFSYILASFPPLNWVV